MRILALILFCLLTLPSVNAHAANCNDYNSCLKLYLPYAAQLKASKVDPSLPNVSLGEWLSDVLGTDARIKWDINDCGEQTGNPEIDKDMDIPTCVEVDASMKDGREVILWLAVGTSQRGITGDPGLFFGMIKNNGHEAMIKKLSDLPGILKSAGVGSTKEK